MSDRTIVPYEVQNASISSGVADGSVSCGSGVAASVVSAASGSMEVLSSGLRASSVESSATVGQVDQCRGSSALGGRSLGTVGKNASTALGCGKKRGASDVPIYLQSCLGSVGSCGDLPGREGLRAASDYQNAGAETCGGSSGAGASAEKIGRTVQQGINFLRRFFLQSAARDLLPREAVSNCLRRVIPVRAGVDILYAPAVEAAHYSGLMVCKSVWLCPVCSAKISERRRQDLTMGLNNFYASNGVKRALLVTFTLSHHKGDNLSTIKRALLKARRLLVSGRWAKQFSATHHIIGTVRSLEITYGDNGWHPHLHVLYFFNREVAIIPFEDSIKARWGQCVAAVGSFASWDYGVDVRFSDKEVANYVAKFGIEPEWASNDNVLSSGKWSVSHEVTKGPSKVSKNGGKTPLQLLCDFAYGDTASGALFVQYAMNFKGERQLRYSSGLRAYLGLDVELTDEEIADQQPEIAVILAQLNRVQWQYVLGNDVRGELLQVASTGDIIALGVFLRSIGIEGVL